MSLGYAQDDFKPFSEDEALKEIIFESEATELDAAIYEEQVKEGSQRRIDLFNLQKAKFKMLNGDFKTARFLLGRLSDKSSHILPIKLRYLAIIDFIEGKYAASLEKLRPDFLQDGNNYKRVCLLKMINYMALNDTEGIRKENAKCMSMTSDYSKNDQLWLDTMVKLKLRDQAGVRKNLMLNLQGSMTDDEMSKILLKTGLYLGKEDDILAFIAMLPESSYSSKKLREIVAFMYLRKGNYEHALSFVEDIDSANAENIKGTNDLINRKYELAFGHFKLALRKKENSNNALERAIPLSWILKQWDDGLSMINSSTNRSLDPRNKKAVEIAFMIRLKKFKEAQKELALLKIDFQNNPPFEVNVMDTYVNLILSGTDSKIDKRKIEDSAEKSCKAFDTFSCWLSMQYIQWENLGKTIKREDLIYSDKSTTIDSLKEKVAIVPLKETISVDQSDIEELDSAKVNIPGY
jgi:ribosomal protein L22